MQETAGILITAAASTAAVHTLVPDHWLPFVLLGRSQRWSLLKAAWIAGLSSLVHVCISLALGGLALGVGMGAARAMGEKLDVLTGVLLCAFGVVYSAWALRPGGHSHRHTLAGPHTHSGISQDSHEGSRDSRGSGETQGVSQDARASREAYDTHGHGALPTADKTSAYSLMFIVGIHPCVLALPILFASAPLGFSGAALIAVTYAFCTIAAMVAVTLIGLTAARQIRMGFLERRGELVTGVIIFAVGVYMLVHG